MDSKGHHGDAVEANRRNWDERTPIHAASDFYGIESFVAGGSTLQAFESDELGSVEGASLLHLQCHLGLDTLSWARQGAKVTGLDFSEPAIIEARRLASRCGIDARFVVADVYAAAEALGERFDVVYTGLGALNWLPDLPRWAREVVALLKPGGNLYVLEFHPLVGMLSDEGLVFDARWTYFFDEEGVADDDERDYADSSAWLVNTRTHEWSHHLGEVVSSLIDVGLTIDFLHEFDTIAYKPWDFLEEVSTRPACYRIPAAMPQIPLEYSIKASAPL